MVKPMDQRSDKTTDNDKINDPIILADIIGESGRWHRRLFYAKWCFGFAGAFNGLAKAFYAPRQDYWCIDPTSNNPLDPVKINGTLQKCGCKSWAYGSTAEYGQTIVAEWDLVCDLGWIPSATQSIYMVGVFVSAMVMAQLSDKYGRRPVFIAGLITELLGGIVSAAATNIWIFALGRFLVALGTYTKVLCIHILVVEVLGTSRRAFWTQLNAIGYISGHLAMPLVAWLTKDWRLFQVVTTIIVAMTFLLIPLVTESPRWLLTQGRTAEAEKIIAAIVAYNRRTAVNLTQRIKILEEKIKREDYEELAGSGSGPEPDLTQGSPTAAKPPASESRYRQLLNAPHLRIILIVMIFTWFVHGFVYYGVSLNLDQFNFGKSVGIYLGFFLLSIVEVPSYFVNIFALMYMGRVRLMIILLGGCGASFAATMLFAGSGSLAEAGRLTTAMFGKFCITSGFNLIYLVSLEVFPTVLRQTSAGLCSAGARIGAILAPFVKEVSEVYGLWVALLVFAVLSFANMAAMFALPEMRGKEIPDTVREADRLKVSKKSSPVDPNQQQMVSTETIVTKI